MRTVLLIVGLLSSLLSVTSAQPICGANSINVTFYHSPVSPPIPSDYISFSIEVDVILQWTGRSPTAPRPEFTTLMSQLGRPTLRVGGDSTDYSWYNPHGRPYPPYRTRPFRYNITELDIRSIRNGVVSYGGQAVIGVNFRDQGNAQWAIEHVRAIERTVGVNESWLLAIEVGNEVDLYAGNGDRVPTWSPSDYYTEWLYYVQQLKEAVPALPDRLFQAGTYCCYNQFEDDIRSFLPLAAQYMRTFSIHEYPDTTEPSTTLYKQLSDAISQQAYRLITSGTESGNLVSLTDRYGLSGLVIGEGNSNSEPGVLGVCDVFAGSALWAIDTLFELARGGLRRFHFHSHFADLRSPVFFESAPAGVEARYPSVRPLWYGLRFFAMVKEGQPTILARSLTCTDDERVKVWAVRQPSGGNYTTRVAIIHKDLNATEPITVHIDLSQLSPPIVDNVYVIRLVGTPLQKENITLAGQTYTGTKDGLPLGEFVQEVVEPGPDMKYSIVVQPISAVLVSSRKFEPFSGESTKPLAVSEA